MLTEHQPIHQPSPNPLQCAVLTVSDTRTRDTDTSGDYLQSALEAAGHRLEARAIVTDDVTAIVTYFQQWIRAPQIDVIISTGGTGLTGKDVTPEALARVKDKDIPGFGELFRFLSYQKIGSSALQSRAAAALAQTTYVFCLPGSRSACRDAWEMLLRSQLDARTRPCNLVELMPRLAERDHDRL